MSKKTARVCLKYFYTLDDATLNTNTSEMTNEELNSLIDDYLETDLLPYILDTPDEIEIDIVEEKED